MKNFRFVLGVLILLLGVGLLFDQVGLSALLGFGFGRLLRFYWPMLLVVLMLQLTSMTI